MIKLKDTLEEGKVLSVFDFDDTIAKSDAWIYVTKNGKTVKKLDPAQFAVYKPAPEEEFDFKDFDRPLQNPRLIKKNADLLRVQLDKARRSSKGARRVTILTARALGAPVSSFLRSVGIDAYVVPVGSADPKVKADWIERQIKKGYDTVYFMDDSSKNIAVVDKMLKRHPEVKSKTSLIKESMEKSIYKNNSLGIEIVEHSEPVVFQEAEYKGRKVKLNKPMQGDQKKFKVYVKDPSSGNIKVVHFGQGGKAAKKAGQETQRIRKDNPSARKSFRARHKCDQKKDRTSAGYWSCKAW